MDVATPLTPEAQRKQDRARKRKALLAGGVVLGLGAAVTLAAWSDDVFANGTFTTGSFELQGSTTADAGDFKNYDGPTGTPADTASLSFTMAPLDIAPGDVNYAPFWLRVNGTQDALITIPSVSGTTSALNTQLSYKIYTGAPTCDAAGVANLAAKIAYSKNSIDGAAADISAGNQVTAPQAPSSVPLCITVTAVADQTLLPQGTSTTITWRFTGTSVNGT